MAGGRKGREARGRDLRGFRNPEGLGGPEGLDQQRKEWLACSLCFPYFCDRWVQVYDASQRTWLPFRLWDSQLDVAETLAAERLVVMLKARQLGMSWLVCGYALWLMLFRPAATVLLFSKRDKEAVDLLSVRLQGMYRRLPPWLRHEEVVVDNAHEVRLSNGSAGLAFPTTGGRSYTGTFALVDEADYCDLEVLLDAVKPTIDGGGQLVLLSTVDKGTPGSAFKRIYQAAKAGANGYVPVFLPWAARPDREPEWYEGVKADILARSGSLDSLYAEYPATDVEALAPRSSDARFAAAWCNAADDTGASQVRGARGAGEGEDRANQDRGMRGAGGGEDPSADGSGGKGFGIRRESPSDASPLRPSLPGIMVWDWPRAGGMYVIGADPAEGNPQSDESAACVMDAVTGDQVAAWAGRFEPATFAAGLQRLAEWYGSDGASAGILVERNNHGHAVLLALREGGAEGILRGLEGQPGWLMNAKGKGLAVDAGADLLRDGMAARRSPKVRDPETLRQLVAFSGSALAAPPGDHDDRCMAWCLAAAAARYCSVGTGQAAVIPPAWQIDQRETGGW